MRTWAKAELMWTGLSHSMKGRILRFGDCDRVAQGKKPCPKVETTGWMHLNRKMMSLVLYLKSLRCLRGKQGDIFRKH